MGYKTPTKSIKNDYMNIIYGLKRIVFNRKRMSVRSILKGIKYLVFVDDTYHNVLYRRRFSSCKDCINREFIPLVGNVCTEYDELLRIKLLIPEEQCPILKWKKEVKKEIN